VFCILLLLYKLTGKYVENIKIMGTIFNGVPPVSNSVGDTSWFTFLVK